MPKIISLYAPLREWFWSNVRIAGADDCWLWLRAKTQNGYGVVTVGSFQVGAHRVAYDLEIGPVPEGLWVLHSCDRRDCVNPKHLKAGTPRQNSADMLARGRWRPAKRKLTEDGVLMIRERQFTARQYAKMFEVSLGTIHSIWGGRTWKSVQPKENT